jgi:hypothetical protein
MVVKTWANEPKKELNRNVTVRVSAPGHSAGDWTPGACADDGVIPGTDQAAHRWIGDIGEGAAVDAGRGNLQHCAVEALVQIVAVIEGHRVVEDMGKDRRRVEPVVQDVIGCR